MIDSFVVVVFFFFFSGSFRFASAAIGPYSDPDYGGGQRCENLVVWSLGHQTNALTGTIGLNTKGAFPWSQYFIGPMDLRGSMANRPRTTLTSLTDTVILG